MRSRTWEPGASSVLPRGGTLIVPVPCADGIVVCADKRENDDLNGATDNRLKVHDIPGPAVFTHYGDVSLVSKNKATVVYDAAASTLDFLRENTAGFDTPEVWHRIATAVKRPFLDAMYDSETPVRLPEGLGFGLVFFWFNDGKLRGVILPCTYVTGMTATIRVNQNIIQAPALLGQELMALGNTDVYNELRRGNDPRFDELRKDPLFQRFFKGSLATETSHEDARSYAKKLVGVSSEHSKFVGDKLDNISPTVDCVLLRSDGSFDWLDKDSPAPG